MRADVVDVRFHQSWVWNEPAFTVTAEYETPSGPHRTEQVMITPPEKAPIPGGTVLAWFAGDGSDPSNVDVAEDPESILDPHAAELYRAPSDS